MSILLFGANGQLGSDILRAAGRTSGLAVVPVTRRLADVADPAAVAAVVEGRRPDFIINTAAYTNVNAAEGDPAAAFAVNAIGAWHVARAAAAGGIALLHVSTDYVFDGSKGSPYLEADARRALNVYGASKLAGEDLVRIAHPGAVIVRVSGLYGQAGASGKGGNFVETMLRLAHAGQPVRVVNDQVTAPTNTAVLAEALLALANVRPEGTYHLAPVESCSWFEFAAAIFEEAGLCPDLQPVTSAEFASPAVRPANSALGSTRWPTLGSWREGLQRYFRERGER